MGDRRYPTAKDAAFWADLAYTLISEIKCECGFVNKVQDEWNSGFFRAECGGCSEELAIHVLLRTPDRTKILFDIIDNDVDVPAFKAEKKQNHTKIAKKEKHPIPTQEELAAYLRELQKNDQKIKCKECETKSVINPGDNLIEWNDIKGGYIEWHPEKDEKKNE